MYVCMGCSDLDINGGGLVEQNILFLKAFWVKVVAHFVLFEQ